ncbi:MAG: hypothetical protein ACREF1_03760 [Acetobacteraceae bacterium]
MIDDAQPTAMAALMLAESLMLALMEAGLIGDDEVAGAIEDVIASQRAMAADSADPAVVQAAERMMHRIADRLVGALPRRRRR